jgi:hypothetical protein
MSRTRIAGAGYQGAVRRPDVADDPHLSHVVFRIAARSEWVIQSAECS